MNRTRVFAAAIAFSGAFATSAPAQQQPPFPQQMQQEPGPPAGIFVAPGMGGMHMGMGPGMGGMGMGPGMGGMPMGGMGMGMMGGGCPMMQPGPGGVAMMWPGGMMMGGGMGMAMGAPQIVPADSPAPQQTRQQIQQTAAALHQVHLQVLQAMQGLRVAAIQPQAEQRRQTLGQVEAVVAQMSRTLEQAGQSLGQTVAAEGAQPQQGQAQPRQQQD